MTQPDESSADWQIQSSSGSTYWLHQHPQRSRQWHQERYRLTASIFSSIVHPTAYHGPDDVIASSEARRSGVPISIDLFSKLVMDAGTINEPVARSWYEHLTGFRVEEVGLAVPTWDTRLGASVDGIVTTPDGCGLIEIKSPSTLYPALRDDDAYREWSSDLQGPPTYPHVRRSHYDQIQGCLAILGLDWCDYVVYGHHDHLIYIERIPRDPEYWSQVMYPKICQFLNDHPDVVAHT